MAPTTGSINEILEFILVRQMKLTSERHDFGERDSNQGLDWERQESETFETATVVIDENDADQDLRTRNSRREAGRPEPKKQPRYNVILWDDNDHTDIYVIRMMGRLFGHSRDQAAKLALTVDLTGKAVCLTTTLEHAELKRDQIHAFGKDPEVEQCQGSMSASIEPVDES